MNRGIYTKWIIGLAFLLLIVAAGCILYYQHTTAPYKAEAEKTDKLLEKWKADKATPPTPAETESTQAPTAEKPTITIGEERTETNTDKSTEPVTIATPEQDNTEEVKVSSHGFGPYPEVPEDFPREVDWSSYEGKAPIRELMTRVRIKLWKQGHRTDGIVEKNGSLYPIMRGTVYIKWSDNGKDIIEITGHPKDLSDDVVDQMDESGTIPGGLTVFDADKASIDPYKFLNLQGVNSYDEANFNAHSRFDK